MGKSSKNLKDFGAPAARLLAVALVILVAGSSSDIGFSTAQSTKTLESLDNVSLYHAEVSYKEPLLMYRNLGKGQFGKVSDSLGTDFMRPIVGRGLAPADYDNDGDIDIVTNNRGDYPSFLRNDGGNANNWMTVQLVGTKSNRDGIGASLKLTSEGFVQVEQAKGGTSYMSASDPRIHFGLAKRTKITSLEITWPSGQVDRLTNVGINQIITVKEGAGIIPRPFPKIPSSK